MTKTEETPVIPGQVWRNKHSHTYEVLAVTGDRVTSRRIMKHEVDTVENFKRWKGSQGVTVMGAGGIVAKAGDPAAKRNMVEVDLMVWVQPRDLRGGHVPGIKRVELPAVPHTGDLVVVADGDAGTPLKHVVMIPDDPVPIAIFTDNVKESGDEVREVLEFWIGNGFEFDDCADKYLKS